MLQPVKPTVSKILENSIQGCRHDLYALIEVNILCITKMVTDTNTHRLTRTTLLILLVTRITNQMITVPFAEICTPL